MCFCLRQTDVNKLYLHRTRIAHALLHLLAAAGEKRQHTESTVWPLPIVSLCLSDVSFDSKKTLMVVSECSSSDPWFRPAVSAFMQMHFSGPDSQGGRWHLPGNKQRKSNKSSWRKQKQETSVKGTRLTASAGLLNDRQTKCAIFEKLLKPTWCTANWSLSRESSMLMWKSTGCEPETATLPLLQSAVITQIHEKNFSKW